MGSWSDRGARNCWYRSNERSYGNIIQNIRFRDSFKETSEDETDMLQTY
jgi:hypothetical protein